MCAPFGRLEAPQARSLRNPTFEVAPIILKGRRQPAAGQMELTQAFGWRVKMVDYLTLLK